MEFTVYTLQSDGSYMLVGVRTYSDVSTAQETLTSGQMAEYSNGPAATGAIYYAAV